MLNCHEATKLLSESRDRKLSGWERIGLRFHTMMCKACKNFDTQTKLLSRAMKSFSSKIIARRE